MNERFSVVGEDKSERATGLGFQRGASASVDFVLSGDCIQVMDESALKFSAAVTLSNEGFCKLRVDKIELDQWQVRRMALEELFFVLTPRPAIVRRGSTMMSGV